MDKMLGVKIGGAVLVFGVLGWYLHKNRPVKPGDREAQIAIARGLCAEVADAESSEQRFAEQLIRLRPDEFSADELALVAKGDAKDSALVRTVRGVRNEVWIGLGDKLGKKDTLFERQAFTSDDLKEVYRRALAAKGFSPTETDALLREGFALEVAALSSTWNAWGENTARTRPYLACDSATCARCAR